MATIKSYTDLEQSKKLAEILPVESADMFYCKLDRSFEGILDNWEIHLGNIPKYRSEIAEYVPCWSLAALLSILPQPHLERFDKGTWICSVFNKDNHFIDNASKNDPVDACYELILKLNELKLL